MDPIHPLLLKQLLPNPLNVGGISNPPYPNHLVPQLHQKRIGNKRHLTTNNPQQLPTLHIRNLLPQYLLLLRCAETQIILHYLTRLQ